MIKKNLIMLYRLYLLVFSLAAVTSIFAQEEWIVPEDKKAQLSPFEFSDETRKSGADIYSTNCKSCHGAPGQNNYTPLVPPPGDPGAADFQANTDGEFYHKIREGRGLMQSYKNILTPEETWNVISYIRSFNTSYVQEVSKEIPRGAYDGEVAIYLAYNEPSKVIEAQVIGTNQKGTEPITGASVNLSVKRMFGDYAIEDPKITNKEGKVLFVIKDKLPGDKEGNITLEAKLTDMEAFGVVTADTLIALGTPMTKGSLLEERALWNKVSKAPIWLLLAYFATVVGVWSALFFILFQLRKIYFIGKEK
jgi:mono/diheme cytochrome c family protein